MDNNSSPVYLYEVDALLGGDALTPYDLASLAVKDIRWIALGNPEEHAKKNAA